jgi:hypothetical protein
MQPGNCPLLATCWCLCHGSAAATPLRPAPPTHPLQARPHHICTHPLTPARLPPPRKLPQLSISPIVCATRKPPTRLLSVPASAPPSPGGPLLGVVVAPAVALHSSAAAAAAAVHLCACVCVGGWTVVHGACVRPHRFSCSFGRAMMEGFSIAQPPHQPPDLILAWTTHLPRARRACRGLACCVRAKGAREPASRSSPVMLCCRRVSIYTIAPGSSPSHRALHTCEPPHTPLTQDS